MPSGSYPELHSILTSAYRGEYGLETAEQSCLNLIYLIGADDPDPFRIFGDSDERYHAHDGSQTFTDELTARLDADSLELQHELVRVSGPSEGPYELTFDTSSGSEVVTADIVILTVPFAVLRDLDLANAGFDERKMLAIEDLGRGRNGKLQMQFTSRLWNQAGAWPAPSNGSTYADTGYQASWDASR